MRAESASFGCAEAAQSATGVSGGAVSPGKAEEETKTSLEKKIDPNMAGTGVVFSGDPVT